MPQLLPNFMPGRNIQQNRVFFPGLILLIIVLLTLPATSRSVSTLESKQTGIEGLMKRKADLDMERFQLETQRTEHVAQIIGMTARGPTRATYDKMSHLEDRFAAYQVKEDDFEKDWEAFYSVAKNSPELKRLMTAKALLDKERARLEAELAVLIQTGRKVSTISVLRVHKDKLMQLNDELVAYRQKRTAFEKERQAYPSSP
ncbi:MAG: hypothetical protein Q8P24_04955 [Desulfobacterales bacterium]|nr:hypothetical protein [Desulfobacterales bacterium]